MYEGNKKKAFASWELYKQTIPLKNLLISHAEKKEKEGKRLQASRKKGYFIHLINLIASAWASFERSFKVLHARYGWMDLRDGKYWLRGSTERGDELH